MPRRKKSHYLYPPLTVANVHLKKSFSAKYLGEYIDCHLTWHDHIDYICGKITYILLTQSLSTTNWVAKLLT